MGKLLIKIGEKDMKKLTGFGIVLLSLVVALSLGISFAQNATLSKQIVNVTGPANNSTVNNTTVGNIESSLVALQNMILQLQNATMQLQNVASQLQNATLLQNETQNPNITQLQNATNELQNATDKIQDAANPFAKVKGKVPVKPT